MFTGSNSSMIPTKDKNSTCGSKTVPVIVLRRRLSHIGRENPEPLPHLYTAGADPGPWPPGPRPGAQAHLFFLEDPGPQQSAERVMD
jgi:hypothetical protein